MKPFVVERVLLGDSTAVVAVDTGTYWLVDASACADILPLSTPMQGTGSLGSTAGLLRGAIESGLGACAAGLRRCATSLPQYVLDLVGSYHNARRTSGHYRRAAARFRQLERADVAAYLERHAIEENGHERLALRDLCALGLPGERLVANLVPDGVGPVCELFDRLAGADYPIGCIGYSFFFESSAAKRTKADVETMQALSPTGIDATRFMRAHSSMGSEGDHVRDMIAFIASLPASDRIEIARAAYETAVLTAGLRRDLHKSDEAIWGDIRAAVGEDLALPA